MFPAPLSARFGRYELLTLLACGGMAEVYLARMTGVGGFARQLVIKRILPHLTGDPEFVEMFLNEGRIAARLSHPNVCQVHELGEVDGNLFLAMEYLDGLSWGELSPLVPRDGVLELRLAAAVIGQVCEGLRYAHELRDVDGTATPVVHRDVSPQNLMITIDGVCKLVDFGVSKVLTEGSRTRTGMLKGKLPYMAPEQIRGEPIDPRADVFSMGTVLWEALVGERLFRRDSDYQIWRAITEEDIPTVTSRRPSLPAAIDAVITRALARDAGERYPTIRAFAGDLREVADRVGGPLEPRAVAELVRTLGRVALAERALKVSQALGRVPPEVAPGPRGEKPPVAVPPSATDGVQLRSGSVRLGRTRRAWGWIALGGLAMAGGGVVAAVWTSADNAPGGVVAATAGPGGDAGAAVGMAARVTEAVATFDAGLTPDAANLPAQVVALDAGEPRGDPPGAVDSVGSGSDGALRRPPRHRVQPRKPDPPAALPGQYSVDSKPYATIYIDGKSYGETPLFKLALPPGRHRVRAVTRDGAVQRFAITIEPGKLVSSGTLAW